MSGARRLGVWSASALVVANMIGAGVFTTSGFSLHDLGRREWVMLAWLVGGVIAMCGALSYGALARRMPESGGEYYFLSRIVHPLVGFLAGWVSLLAGFTAPIAASALLLQAYLVSSFGLGGRPEWIGTAAIAVATLMHGLRLGHGVWIQNVAVATKLLLIVGFVAFGASRVAGGGGHADDVLPAGEHFDVGSFAVALVWISFAYSGWNAAVYVAGEVREPERNLHRSLWLATAVVTAAYLGLNAVFVYSAPLERLDNVKEVGAVAAEALGGAGLQRAVSALVALALFTSISAMTMAGPRVYARMADDGLFPRMFAAGGDVPTVAVALQAALAVVVVWISGLRELLLYIGFTLGLSAAATVVALLLVRRRDGRERVPIPGHPFVPLAYVAATLGVSAFMVLRQPREALSGLATVATGVPVYFLLRRLRRG